MPNTERPSDIQTQEPRKPNALKRFWKFIRGGNTPKEKEVSSAYEKTKSESRNALRALSENAEETKRNRIDALRKIVISVSDIAQSREAIRAYQELILLTNPARFHAEIRIIDGVCGQMTRAAYEADKKVLTEPRRNFWQRLFSRTPKPEDPKKKKPEKDKKPDEKTPKVPTESKIGTVWWSIKSSGIQKSETGTTLCSRTALNNMNKFVSGAPSGNANDIYSTYVNGLSPSGMITFRQGGFNPPENSNVADILLDTPQKPTYPEDYGHRAVAYKENGNWYVLDPYYGWCGREPMPVDQYLSRFSRPGYGIRGMAYYASNKVA